MDKLEQVSENPELKQEMEAEVASTNSNQVICWPSLMLYTIQTYYLCFNKIVLTFFSENSIRS